MLSTLRAVAIIATIFVLSPTRQAPDDGSAPRALPTPARESFPYAGDLRPSSIDPTWIDGLAKLWSGLSDAGRGLVSTLVRRAETIPDDPISRQLLAGAKASRDTLRPEDRRPIWRGQESGRPGQ